MVPPPTDATRSIYSAGGLLILLGVVQLAKGNMVLGVVSLVLGPALIVQRLMRNRNRDRAIKEKRP